MSIKLVILTFHSEGLVYSMMILLIILLFILNCSREVKKPPPPDLPYIMLESLKNGFTYNWDMIRERGEVKTEFKASGIYSGEGKFTMDGLLKVGETEEEIKDINPYVEIKNLTGDGDFEYLKTDENKYIYGFTANLTLLFPGGKKGKGMVTLSDEGIEKITAESNNAYWEMEIEHTVNVRRRSIDVVEGIPAEVLRRRIEYYGGLNVELKKGKVFFEELRTVDRKGILFNRGNHSVYELTHSPEGNLFLAPDSLERYNIVNRLNLNISEISIRENELGGYWLTLVFDKSTDANLIGITVDDILFGIGHPGGRSFRFPISNDKLAYELYAVLKSNIKQEDK